MPLLVERGDPALRLCPALCQPLVDLPMPDPYQSTIARWARRLGIPPQGG